MKRFKAALTTGNYPDNPEPLVRDVNGDFVKYEDALRLELALKEMIAEFNFDKCIQYKLNALNMARDALKNNE
jgi:hypothetical protein